MPMTRANAMRNNKGPVEEGVIDDMVSTLGSSLESVLDQAMGNIVTNEQMSDNPLALKGGWNHPLAWANTSPAIQASPLAPLLLGGEVQLGFPEDPFMDEIHNLQDHPPLTTHEEKTEVKRLTKLYKEEAVQTALIRYLDRCELKGVTDRFDLSLQNIDSRMRDLPPMWVIEMGELILQGAARRWQGLMAAAIRASTVEVRRKIIKEKKCLKQKYPHSYRRICHDAYTRGNLAAKKIDKLQPPETKFYLLQGGTPLMQYINEKTSMEITEDERKMVMECMRNIGINSPPEDPEFPADEPNNEIREPEQRNKSDQIEQIQEEEQTQGAILPPPPSSNGTEEIPQAENDASEERVTQIDLPPGGEDNTQVSLPINNSIRSPGTLELFLPTPSSPPCSSGLKEREEACHKLLEKVVGAIGQLENVISNLNDKITAIDLSSNIQRDTEEKGQENQGVEQNKDKEEIIQKKKKDPETWMAYRRYAKRKTEEDRRYKNQPKNGKTQRKTQNTIPQNTKGNKTGGKSAQNSTGQGQHPPTRGHPQMRTPHLTSYPRGHRNPRPQYQKKWQPHKQNHPQNRREMPQEQTRRQNRDFSYHKNHPNQYYQGQNPHWMSHPQPWKPPQRQGRYPQRGNYHWAQGQTGGRQWQEGGYGRWGWN